MVRAAVVIKTPKNVLHNIGLGNAALLISPIVCASGKPGSEVERHLLTTRRPGFMSWTVN